jgi:hypothetical protein
MAVKRDKSQTLGLREIGISPMPWRQISGDVEIDASRVVGLPTRPQRIKEMKRLNVIHGLKHAEAVERRVIELWKQRTETISTEEVACSV